MTSEICKELNRGRKERSRGSKGTIPAGLRLNGGTGTARTTLPDFIFPDVIGTQMALEGIISSVPYFVEIKFCKVSTQYREAVTYGLEMVEGGGRWLKLN